jgi:hypothetical protein
MARNCPCCGQALPEVRLGARLTPLKARIFDIIARAGAGGVQADDLQALVFSKGQGLGGLKAHVWQINELIADEGYHIRSRSRVYVLGRWR